MGNAGAIYADIAPTLESQVANPQGFTPADEAAMETGAQQSAGGSQSAAVGQGGLLAARTGNAGAAQRSIADASRGAGEQLSQNLLRIRTQNAQLKQRQREQGLSELGGLFGTNVEGGNRALGEIAPLVQANLNAEQADPWNQFFSGLAKAGGAGIGTALTTGG